MEQAQSANQNISFNFSIDENLKNKKFSSVVGVNLYRTIEESVNNAMKYANADHIVINAEKFQEGLKIEIKDDGKGFDTENVDVGNGLLNMKKTNGRNRGKFFHQFRNRERNQCKCRLRILKK